jgi:hypothetical protein
VGTPEEKRSLGSPRRRWVDNIKIYLGDIGWDGVDWIRLVQDRELGNESSGSTKFWEILE